MKANVKTMTVAAATVTATATPSFLVGIEVPAKVKHNSKRVMPTAYSGESIDVNGLKRLFDANNGKAGRTLSALLRTVALSDAELIGIWMAVTGKSQQQAAGGVAGYLRGFKALEYTKGFTLKSDPIMKTHRIVLA